MKTRIPVSLEKESGEEKNQEESVPPNVKFFLVFVTNAFTL